MDANEFAAYAATITGAPLLADELNVPGPYDTDTCPNPIDPYEPTHTWVTRSYEPREHCSCGILRYPDPTKPCRHKP